MKKLITFIESNNYQIVQYLIKLRESQNSEKI
jgi:hypothetical protein